MESNFADRLAAGVTRRDSPVCVGLDPRWELLPDQVCGGDSLVERAAAYQRFCRGVIDVVAPLAPVVKPQAAFFEELGPAGMSALAAVVAHARQRDLLVILDGKRNDIGSTAEAYARAYLGSESAWGADALTVSPYLGNDSLQPFFDVAAERGAGVFVLVKTSNPGGRMLQDLVGDGRPMYAHVAEHIERAAAATAASCGYGCVGSVVGATYPHQLAELRATLRHSWLLVPGYGSQGGTATDVAAAFDARGLGAIINNSRGILFAYQRPEYARFGPTRWQDAIDAATRDMIAELRSAGWSLAAEG